MTMSKLRIAMLTYSLRPRGGVVHALEVSEALARRGHEVCLFALGRPNEQFFRPPAVPEHIVRFTPPDDAPFDERIMAMLAAYRDGLAGPLVDGDFDIVHSQDCLSANAALELRDRGLIGHVIRTVHHVDDFTSPSLIECQDRSIAGPDALFCVSEPWVERLRTDYGAPADVVRNGVDTRRFRPPKNDAERHTARQAFCLGDHFTVLTIGGIEPRKGTLTLLEGFARLRSLAPELDARLVVAGGATLFDYRSEVERFHARVAELGLGEAVHNLGTLEDGEIERLYRAADVFAFPSTKEGFGLAALEALASGLPVVASDLDALTTFLTNGHSALLVPVGDHNELAAALAHVGLNQTARQQLRANGLRVAADYTWDRAAAAHEDAYTSLQRELPTARAARV